ncbi:hypothetical protein V1283_008728 [Bradyrhizobium sp. AZCC 2262]|uniref:hypothetical protein n=1 Tax=Bradyrhizobium sp. AZCC 2262 TaxID=3117022 RepID=UPI002FF2F1F7
MFELTEQAAPIILESVSGRAMTLVPGDLFLGTPGHRESTRWVVGRVPPGGLRPGASYWVLADSGVVGELIGDSPLAKAHLAQVTYRGAILNNEGEILDLGRFALVGDGKADHGAPIFLIVGTSAEVGKTTAGTAVLRTLLGKGHVAVTALKATGTSSLTEILRYRDFGAARTFDCVDFGLPTTYPSGRHGADAIFNRALDVTLSNVSDGVLIECGGDILGGNVPIFLECLKRRRAEVKIILAAADALGALGAKQLLGEMGLSISMITGPCTDTPTLRERTQALCGIPALNMSRGAAPI